ncbi:MAG: hypothetical protein K2Q14_00785 [Gammaproteobacteria bacterium]|nr:hypothetical protein [Gammaproteobacteria bacterium]
MMKLAMKKTLAAAILSAMAISGAANAAYFTGGASGDSDLIFSAWDNRAGVGYALDLGVSMNTLFGADNATTGSNLATANSTVLAAALNNGLAYQGALSSFNSFVTAAGGPSSIMWNMAAAENNGRARVLTTQGAAATVANFFAAQTNGNIAATANAFNSYVAAAGAKSAGNNYVNTVAADGAAYPGTSTWGTLLGGKGLDSANLLSNGFSTNLYLFGQTSTDAANLADLGIFSRAMTVDGRVLNVTVFQDASGAWDIKVSAQVAAVPEADTFAMFLAGFGLICFIILRRRMQNR